MLKENLDLMPQAGERRRAPTTLAELQDDYLHSADITAVSRNGDPARDANKILTLKPNGFANDYACYNKGYFAYGEAQDCTTVFRIYSPRGRRPDTFPPRSLETIVGLFAIRLTQEGYELPQNFVKFHPPEV